VGEVAVADRGTQPGRLAGVVAPRLVAGEQHAVVADPAPLDLLAGERSNPWQTPPGCQLKKSI